MSHTQAVRVAKQFMKERPTVPIDVVVSALATVGKMPYQRAEAAVLEAVRANEEEGKR
jgi:hypothetical protein